jgi:hypothetical protein
MTKEQEILFKLSDEMLDIVNHKDDFVNGDLQGAIEAIISKAILEGEGIERDNNTIENMLNGTINP